MVRAILVSLLITACGSTNTGGTGGGSATGGGSPTGGGSAGTGGGSAGTGGGSAGTGGGSAGTGGGSAGTGGGSAGTGGGAATGGGTAFTGIKKVFVIVMENQGTSAIYASANAPYLNGTLMVQGGHASMFGDVLASSVPSEPHYVWMEAGTNAFTDHTFSNDNDPSASNSTSSTAHLSTQLSAAGKTWRAYQEDLATATTGDCPITSGNQFSNWYAAKHNPFVFFQDVSGSPPSKTNSGCASHHRAYTKTAFGMDLSTNDVADYTFITPNQCNDMHGAICSNGCLSGSSGTCVLKGDEWLMNNVPPILTYIATHDGVLFIVWDEPDTASMIQPFVVVGPHVKANHTSTVAYDMSSYLKSVELIMRLPVLSNVQGANDFSDFFEPGYFP